MPASPFAPQDPFRSAAACRGLQGRLARLFVTGWPHLAECGGVCGFRQGPPQSLGIVAEQLAGYPHKNARQASCSRRQRSGRTAVAQACHGGKCRLRLQKMDLSTEKRRLYYYHYVFIKPLKNNQGQPGPAPASLPVRGCWDVLAIKKIATCWHKCCASCGFY